MFAICPKGYVIEDFSLFDDVEDAKESALDWSAELGGEGVMVYEAIQGNYGYDYKPICEVFA